MISWPSITFRSLEAVDDSVSRIGLLEESENLAKDRRDGADNYAREISFALEERISTILGQVRSGLDLLDEESENISVEENK